MTLTPVPLAPAAAASDLRRRRIPNGLVLPSILLGFAAQSILSGLPGVRAAGLGFALGFLLYFPLWLLHARGAGDVKLLAAAGTYLGPGNTLVLFLLAAILGGILALLLVLLKNRGHETARNVAAILGDLLQFRRPARTLAEPGALTLPHAPVLAIATYCVLAMDDHISQTHAPFW